MNPAVKGATFRFPTLAVRVRELRRLVASGAPSGRVRSQARELAREHRRRLRLALHGLRTLKPYLRPELKPLWLETIDSAILLLQLNRRDFKKAMGGVTATRT